MLIDVFLDRHWHAVQWSDGAVRRKGRVESGGVFEGRIAQVVDDGVHRRVAGMHALDIGGDDGRGRKLTRGDLLGDFARGQLPDF